MSDITWVQRRGQIKHLLYELCLTGRIDRATFYEQIADLNKVAPVVRCKDCKYGFELRNGKFGCDYFDSKYPYADDYAEFNPEDFCSGGERKVEE